jgi:glutathione S-transferase
MSDPAEYTPHCFPESGGCYKVALMLALCGAGWRAVWIDYHATQQRAPNWRTAQWARCWSTRTAA